nr:EamA family transporter [uncultured Thiodictyon sp.]
MRTLVILVMTAGILTARGEWSLPGAMRLQPLSFLALSGLATGCSWLLYYRALQLAPASLVAPIDKLSVAFAIVLAVLFLGEAVTLKLTLGGLFILVGALILAWP